MPVIFRRNVVANLLTTGWMALLQFLITPIILWKLGVAGYALVAFFATFMAFLAVLDLGLSATLTRKIARRESPGAAVLLRSFEVVYALVGVSVGCIIVAFADVIATRWLHSRAIDEHEIRLAVRLMGILFALRWVQLPYVALLQGLQRQQLLGFSNAILYTLANSIALASLWLVSAEPTVFFAFLAVGTLVQFFALRTIAWRGSDVPRRGGEFDKRAFTSDPGFSAGMLGISLTAIVLLHTDKLILSRIVSLEEFGVYAVGQALAASLNTIVLPVFNATYPRLCELIARSDESGLGTFYRSVTQLMNALVVPVMCMLVLFPGAILSAWTGNLELSRDAAPVLALLAAGTGLNALMYPAYGLQLARGNTHIALRTNLMLCLLVIPGTAMLASRYGSVGAAAVWPIVNFIYVGIGIPWTYRACLKSRAWPGFYRALASQQGPTLVVAGVAYAWLPMATHRTPLILELLLLGGTLMAVSLACSPVVRDGWRHWFQRASMASS